jgi:DNA repair protein RadC
MKEESIHKGHRQRLINKFISSPDSCYEHEILEVLLFYAIPRKDTNALAHELIKKFGGLNNVFKAEVNQLKEIKGVGDKVATQIMLVGKIAQKLCSQSDKKVFLTSPEQIRNHLIDDFMGARAESFIMILLDKNYMLKAKVVFTDDNPSQVRADIPEIVQALQIHKPTYAVIAHNHPSNRLDPSEEDDFTTKKINVLCELHDVILSDHIIFAGQRIYSYKTEGKMQEIRKTVALNALFDKIKEN